MFDAKRLLDQFLGGRAGGPGGFGGGAGGLGGALGGGKGAMAASLAGLLLGSKRGRSFGASGLKAGGMAMIASLAYKAYQDWQAQQQAGAPPSRPGRTATGGFGAGSPGAGTFLGGAQDAARGWTAPPPPPPGSAFEPRDERETQELGRALVRAMIAAAKADGHIDASEQARIFAELERLPLDAEDRGFVMEELKAPLDVEAVARGARTPEQAAEIYAASLLAIDVDSAAERGYLSLLASRLNLNADLVRALHETVGQVPS